MMKSRIPAFLLVAVTLGATSRAYAQASAIDKPLPNVLLLVDNSGSMERLLDGHLPGDPHDANSACTPGTVSTANRWGTLVQALTGTFADGYMCGKVDRSGSQFIGEYGAALGGAGNLYDARYFLPYHRPVGFGNGATKCTVGPKLGATGNQLELVKWDDVAAGSANPGACPLTVATADPDGFLNQATDGQLDSARPFLRLGLMTFDSTQGKAQDASGMWSYPTDGFGGISGHGQGQLAACLASDMEVGARNSSAPDFEGRMVLFPPPFAGTDQIDAFNNDVQRTLLAARPYGATPIAGLLDDARHYFWKDSKGPQSVDPYVQGGCREEFAILLTDGGPNLDMRPECTGSSGGVTGTCPYAPAKDIAQSMFEGTATANFGGAPGKKVTTFVVGFSVNGSGGVADGFPAPTPTCGQWYTSVAAGQPAGTSDKDRAQAFVNTCKATNPARGSAAAACCNLHEISVAGNGGPAFFAESQADLVKAFGTILGVIAKGTSTRTVPSYAAPTGTSSASATFVASFDPQPLAPWAGNIQRSRLRCEGGTRTADPTAIGYGDDFAINLGKQALAGKRRFLLVKPDGLDGKGSDDEKKVTQSVRPFASGASDGMNSNKSTEIFTTNPIGDLPLSSKSIDKGVCKTSVDATGHAIPALSQDDCKKAVIGFTVAEPSLNLGAPAYNFGKFRCPGGECSAMGAIFRSNPTVVGPPSAVLRDESYRAFADRMKNRPTALYVASIDGQLHAFKADVDTDGAGIPKPDGYYNELWSFIPPALYASLDANYPRGNQILLDGTVASRDVVFERGANDVTSAALTSGATYEKWHSVVVGSFGVGGFGYYALDVTDPGPGTFDATSGTGTGSWAKPTTTVPIPTRPSEGGPHFLWQIVDSEDDPSGKGKDNGKGGAIKRADLFATRTPTPAVTTLFFKAPGAAEVKEIAVAILPGGTSGPPATTPSPKTCARDDLSTLVDPAFPARPAVRNWGTCPGDGASPVAGRSVMVVRVDTGEVIRVFGRDLDVPARFKAQGRLGNQPVTFHAPMVGTPVVYPGGTGAIGQKAFVGDADGMLWRMDFTDPDPKNWTAKLFHDTYAAAANIQDGIYPPTDAQPLLLTPVLAADQDGNIVLGIATGDNDAFAPDGRNFLYSLSEKTSFVAGSTRVGASVNWYLRFNAGERVSGPMSIFDSNLFFSTYVPAGLGNVCAPGQARLWGRDYIRPLGADLSRGGLRRTPVADGTLSTTDDFYPAGDALIPGVSIRAVPACGSSDLGQGLGAAGASFTSGSYELFAPVAKEKVQGTLKTPDAIRVTLPLVKNQTRVDSWAAVVE